LSTRTGLKVRCERYARAYPKEIKTTDAKMATLNINGDAFRLEWN